MSEYSEILDRIEEVLEDKVRPNLALHGGNIRSLDCKDGVYRFQLTGQCAGCPSAMLTTENLIRSALLESIPELKDVVLVGGVSQELLDQAKAILRGGASVRIGVKYCGGCNPRYDRVALVERIQRGQPEDIFEGAIPGVCYDQLLVVCGCSAQCADLTGLTGREIRSLWQDHP